MEYNGLATRLWKVEKAVNDVLPYALTNSQIMFVYNSMYKVSPSLEGQVVYFFISAKVADFGLSRPFEKETMHYKLKNKEALPQWWYVNYPFWL